MDYVSSQEYHAAVCVQLSSYASSPDDCEGRGEDKLRSYLDFRSPRRPLPGIQDFHNRKGLISDRGEKKKAFYVMQQYYRELAATSLK